jgi:hypothetical protein
VRWPCALTWNTTSFNTGAPRGAAGVALLLAFPFAVALIPQKRFAGILTMTAVLYFFLWAFTFQNARYYVHILPVICVLGTATLFHLPKNRWSAIANRVCLAVILVFQFPVTSMMFWNDYERFPLRAATGIEGSEEFLNRSLPGYAAVTHLNAWLKPGERVAGEGVENTRFYLNAPLETMADSTLTSALRIAASKSTEELSRMLREAGFAYVFAARESVKKPPAWAPYVAPEFLKQFATPVYADSNSVVYRLNP